jgi:dolichyl-phosphate beta-glucosyltransferase
MPHTPTTHASLSYSIVIPAYNEAKRVGATLERVLAYVARQQWNAEVILVNDGSCDETREIIQRYISDNPNLRLLENPGNRGKGYSVRHGMLKAEGEVLLFSDADLSSPIEESNKLFAAIADGADVAIGSRWLQAELQKKRQPFYRQLFGRIFNLALRTMLGLRYRDTQCGFKAFTRTAAQSLFAVQKIERWGFDPELLFLANKFGIKVVEIPIDWSHCEGSRIRYFRDGIRMFQEILKVRWYALMQTYDTPVAPQAINNLRDPRKANSAEAGSRAQESHP